MDKLKQYRTFIGSVRSSAGYWKSYALLQFTISLSKLMKREGVSGRKLARDLGVSPAQVSKVLSGNENVTIETMSKFADALGAAVHIYVAKKGVAVQWSELPAEQDTIRFKFSHEQSSAPIEAIAVGAVYEPFNAVAKSLAPTQHMAVN